MTTPSAICRNNVHACRWFLHTGTLFGCGALVGVCSTGHEAASAGYIAKLITAGRKTRNGLSFELSATFQSKRNRQKILTCDVERRRTPQASILALLSN
jgi:hypothetical protein